MKHKQEDPTSKIKYLIESASRVGIAFEGLEHFIQDRSFIERISKNPTKKIAKKYRAKVEIRTYRVPGTKEIPKGYCTYLITCKDRNGNERIVDFKMFQYGKELSESILGLSLLMTLTKLKEKLLELTLDEVRRDKNKLKKLLTLVEEKQEPTEEVFEEYELFKEQVH